jgi:uncharacterized paraquat-inducible protein A
MYIDQLDGKFSPEPVGQIPTDPEYCCSSCDWEGDDPPVGGDGYLVCPRCEAPAEDYPNEV